MILVQNHQQRLNGNKNSVQRLADSVELGRKKTEYRKQISM